MLRKTIISRERVTVFTKVSGSSDINLNPEFVFKGKGIRCMLYPPDGIKFYRAPMGYYRLDQMLKTIGICQHKFDIFTPKDYVGYVLDDCSVHLVPEVKEAFLPSLLVVA